MSMPIHEGHHKFYMGESEQSPVAEITYAVVDDNTIDVQHTFVDPSLRGSGVAKQLFHRVIEKARQEDLTIIPTCSYVRVQFERDASLSPLRHSQ